MERLSRLICVVLLKDNEFYHSVKFKNFTYLGEPLNIVRLFNKKKCSELVILNIDDGINYGLLKNIASQAFMPLSYGGSVESVEDAKKIFSLGYEKIVFKYNNQNVILAKSLVKIYGSQAITICLDYQKTKRFFLSFKKNKGILKSNIESTLSTINKINPGEIILQSIDLDGTELGFDIETLSGLNHSKIPIIPLGGCKNLSSMSNLKEKTNINCFAASTFFVFKNGGILVNFPKFEEILTI